MIERVSKLRGSLSSLPTAPVVYKWWFYEVPSAIISYVDMSRIVTKDIDGKKYYLLYVGVGISCQGRFSWHIIQHHTRSSVQSGFLSTLRKTVSALLGLDMTRSENNVNKYIDECYLEWEFYPGETKTDLEKRETCLLKSGYFPLNIQKNISELHDCANELRRLRHLYKK